MVMNEGIQECFKRERLEIYDSGCYFLDLVEWALRDAGMEIVLRDKSQEFMYSNIAINLCNGLYDACVQKDYMKSDCFVNLPHEVYNQTMKRLACPKRKSNTRILTAGSAEQGGTYIVRWERPMFARFALVYNGRGWDSLEPDRPAAKLYKPASIRVLT